MNLEKPKCLIIGNRGSIRYSRVLSRNSKHQVVDAYKKGQPSHTRASDAMPTPREAARHLARFTKWVQLKRRSPLIATPPRQKAATKRPLPTRSKRIAAQPLAHVLTSKRGEVLLTKRMDNLSNATPTSSVSKRAYDAIFIWNLTSSQVAALDELFPATNNRASRKAAHTLACSSRMTE
jgi:hypothetical protein